MRIFVKKAFGFTNPDPSKEVNGAREVVRTVPNQFQDVPDWVAEDDMFKWGRQDGDIEVVEVATSVTAAAPAETKTATKDAKPAGWVAPADEKKEGK